MFTVNSVGLRRTTGKKECMEKVKEVWEEIFC